MRPRMPRAAHVVYAFIARDFCWMHLPDSGTRSMSAKDMMRDAIRELMASVSQGEGIPHTDPARCPSIDVDEHYTSHRSAGSGGGGGGSGRLGRLCFAFSVGACPSELLYGTKFSIGPCRWLHDGALANSIPAHEISRVELRALRVIDAALEDLDREDRKQRRALSRLGDVRASIEEHDLALEEAIRKLGKKADAIAEDSRSLRARGLLAESQRAMQEARKLEESRHALEERLNRRRHSREQRFRNLPNRLPLQVCELCGLAYGLDGRSNRHSLHTNGKLHRNVLLLRETSSALHSKYSIQPVSKAVDDAVETPISKKSRLNLASTLREDFEREETTTYSDHWSEDSN